MKMNLEEARAIAKAVHEQIYPPINPAVLLEAARTLYLAHEPMYCVVDIIAWCLFLISKETNAATPAQRMEIVGLHFAAKVPR